MTIDDKTIITAAAKLSSTKPHDHDVLIVVGGHLNGALFELDKDRMSAGRSDDCEVILNAPGISRLHFALLRDGNGFEAVDLDSSNGTFVNDTRIDTRVRLSSGDVIKVGHLALKYLSRDAPEIEAHKRLIEQATRDGLTGCFNKKYLFEALERELQNTVKGNETLCLVVIDIDHFKTLNDTEGHDAGDLVLKELALFIQKNFVRSRDVFARFGGEEFVLLLTDTSLTAAGHIAEALRKAVEVQDFEYSDKILRITASVGIAQANAVHRVSANELFIRADKALYKAKESGRNRVESFEDD